MIKALVNWNWESFDDDELQPGTGSFSFGYGLYETFRTKNYKPIFLNQHLRRLFNSAETINLKITYSCSEIGKMIYTVINGFHEKDQRVRIIAVPEKVIIYTTALNFDEKIYEGISTLTVSTQRDNPKVKTTDYTNCLDAYKIAQNKNCFDAILIDDKNQILEGSRSNIFWIMNNSLFTRKDNVLPGITRQMIIEKSPYPIVYDHLNIFDFKRLDELFLTNSGSGIIPVSKIDSTLIGKACPGSITIKLLKLYDSWVRKTV